MTVIARYETLTSLKPAERAGAAFRKAAPSPDKSSSDQASSRIHKRRPSAGAGSTRATFYAISGRKHPPRQFVGVKIDLDDLERVDAIAENEGTTRSNLVREAIANLLERRETAYSTNEIVDTSRLLSRPRLVLLPAVE